MGNPFGRGIVPYTTTFPKITDLDGTCEIGLAEIQYPHSWYSLVEGSLLQGVGTTKAFGLVTGWVLFLGQKDSMIT
jgi:hypothetical protein